MSGRGGPCFGRHSMYSVGSGAAALAATAHSSDLILCPPGQGSAQYTTILLLLLLLQEGGWACTQSLHTPKPPAVSKCCRPIEPRALSQPSGNEVKSLKTALPTLWIAHWKLLASEPTQLTPDGDAKGHVSSPFLPCLRLSNMRCALN